MKSELVNPFYQATSEVFKMMLDIDVTKMNIKENRPLSAIEEVSIKINVTGDVSGFIIYRFSKQLPLEMVKIMSGMEINTLDSFVSSALQEVANIISGNAATKLSSQNFKCDISTPQVYIEADPETPNNIKSLVIPLKTSIGEMKLDIYLEK